MTKVIAILILLGFLWVFSKLMKQALDPIGVIFALLIAVGLLFAIYSIMPWVFTSLAPDLNLEEQDCYGMVMENETKCLGIVMDAH